MADGLMQHAGQTAPVAEDESAESGPQNAPPPMPAFAPPPHGPTQAVPRGGTSLKATAQLLTFAPGLYAVDFVVTRSAVTSSGLRLPCVRLEPVPPGPQSAARCFVSVLADGGWLSQTDQPTYIRSVGGVSAVVFTIYTLAGDAAAPEIRIRKIQPDGISPVGKPGANAQTPSSPVNDGKSPLPITQLVHIQGVGDVQAGAEQWTGQPGSGRQIEGFAIIPDKTVLKSEDIEYQAIMGEQWNTPWSRGGVFCGSRGMGLPLLGLRIRLVGAFSDTHTCTYWGSFANKGVVGPVRAGAACEAEGAVLEAFRVIIAPRGGDPMDPTEPDTEQLAPQADAGARADLQPGSGNKAPTKPKRATRDKAP